MRARAHALKPVVIIGDSGLTPGVLREIDSTLIHHELIKVKIAGGDRAQRVHTLEEVCLSLNAVLVQHIGKVLVIYRKATETEPKKKPRTMPGKTRTKKSYQHEI